MKIGHIVMLTAVWTVFSCHKAEIGVVEDRIDPENSISFYLTASPSPGTRAIVESGDQSLKDLVESGNMSSLYVTDNLHTDIFNNTKISHTGNLVWRSDKLWTQYASNARCDFFAYIYSSGGLDSEVSVEPPSSGRNSHTVTIRQPKEYSSSPDDYADFLMSYIFSTDAVARPLVSLQMERITTCVELYVSTGANMKEGSVVLKDAKFTGVLNSATYSMGVAPSYPSAIPINGMKNQWSVNRGSTEAKYEIGPYLNEPVPQYDADTDPDGTIYNNDECRFMKFLTVEQPTYEELGIGKTRQMQLHVSYSVEQDGQVTEYNVEFNLNDFNPAVWYRGHKIRYHVVIDSSVDLTGVISAWNEVDVIEGTLLPNEPDEADAEDTEHI